jgi:hypothetical protein
VQGFQSSGANIPRELPHEGFVCLDEPSVDQVPGGHPGHGTDTNGLKVVLTQGTGAEALRSAADSKEGQ